MTINLQRNKLEVMSSEESSKLTISRKKGNSINILECLSLK